MTYCRHLRVLTSAALILLAARLSAEPSNFNHAPKIESLFPKVLAHFQTPSTLRQEAPESYQNRLLYLANYYAQLEYVPYIWGGGRVGNRQTCLECRRCVRKLRTPIEKRLFSCQACRSCGIDCSHFVHMLYREAGVEYPYASAWELARQSSRGLLKYYAMVDLGQDLTKAEPGDLLVFKKHVAMLSRVISATNGDFVHATRFHRGRLRLGGVRWEQDRNIKRFRGRLVRILRHKSFFPEEDDFTQFSSKSFARYLASIKP